MSKEQEIFPIEKSEAEWQESLSPSEYQVLRGHGTAFGALAAAAVLAVVLLRARPEAALLSIKPPRYAAPELAPIDSLLTRLEQEKPYAIP